jgi:EAL and modified HD-GYP domain-containing signal transduction protein
MFSRYFRFLKGDKRERREKPNTARPPESASLKDAVPAVDYLPEEDEASSENVIDTQYAPSGEVVTSVLSIATDGKRTTTAELRQKFFGRQPILDRSQQLVGYELLLRNPAAYAARKGDEALQRMYDEMLLGGLLSLDMDKLLGDKKVFVSVSPGVLYSPLLEMVPKEGVVLALRVATDDAEKQFERLKELVVAGYRLALDDFTYTRELEPLLRLARYVRIDVSGHDALELGEKLFPVLEKAQVEPVARNVDTEEAFDACRHLSFHFFQGYYFARRQPGKPPRIGSDRERVIELLNLVMNNAEISALEEVFKRDAALSYRMLRYINSPGCGLVQKLRSIAHALVVLGHDRLYRWLTLLLFSSGKLDVRSQALLKNALVRARLVEILGQRKLPPGASEGLFIAGIFSLLDVLLNIPMEQAVAHLNLPDPVLQALVARQGAYAPFLELAVACEEGDDERIETCAAACALGAQEVNLAHVQAMIWAEEVDK